MPNFDLQPKTSSLGPLTQGDYVDINNCQQSNPARPKETTHAGIALSSTWPFGCIRQNPQHMEATIALEDVLLHREPNKVIRT